jgi:hypothetical protein
MSEPRQGSLPVSEASREVPPRTFWRDARAAFALVFRSPVALFILGSLVFVTELLVVVETGLRGLAYLHSGRAQFWHMILALAPTLWLISLFIVFSDFERSRLVWPRTRSGRLALLLCLVPLVLLIALPLAAQHLIQWQEPHMSTVLLSLDPHFVPKSVGTNLLGLLVATLHASTLVGIHLQLLVHLPRYQHLGAPLGWKSLDEEVLWYQRQQAQLRRCLRLSSVSLGVSILSVSAFRDIVNAALPSSAEPFPTAPVLSYGLYYTGLIACIYLPAHNTLKQVGSALAERLVWQALGAHPTWKQRLEEQQAIRNHLGLQGSALQELQQGLAVLAPLLASISSLALGTGE